MTIVREQYFSDSDHNWHFDGVDSFGDWVGDAEIVGKPVYGEQAEREQIPDAPVTAAAEPESVSVQPERFQVTVPALGQLPALAPAKQSACASDAERTRATAQLAKRTHADGSTAQKVIDGLAMNQYEALAAIWGSAEALLPIVRAITANMPEWDAVLHPAVGVSAPDAEPNF